MQLYQFLKDNLEALAAAGGPAMPFIEQGRDRLGKLEKELIVNNFGFMDIPLPDGGSLFGAMPPGAFYQTWGAGEKPDTSATVIIGSNLGYGLNQVLTQTPTSHKVVVLEPRPEMLGACLGQTDYTQFINAGKLHFIPPDEKVIVQVIKQLDLQLVFGRINLRSDHPSQQLGPEYARWTRIFRDRLEDFAVELSTLRKRQDVMVDNELGNYPRAFADGSVRGLKNVAEGMSAVILGAGPSLSDFAPSLAASRGRALYVTAAQTLPALHSLGLKPDLCMAIDYSPGMLKMFDSLDHEWASDIPFIYSTKVLPEVVERYPGPTIPLWTEGGLGTFMFKGREPVLDAGGSVSVALMRFLEWCGASQILLVGQDFAWRGKSSHVGGHHGSAKSSEYNPKLHVKVLNAAGEELISAIPYVTAQRDMERDVAKMKAGVCNLYGGGLEVAGVRNVTLEEVFMNGLNASMPGSLEAFFAALEQARAPRPRPVFQVRWRQWSTGFKNVIKRLEKLYKKPERNQDQIHQAMGQVLAFLKQDPLYTPYLFNEIMDMAGLVHARSRHARSDLVAFKALTRRVVGKVRRMDEVVGEGADKAA